MQTDFVGAYGAALATIIALVSLGRFLLERKVKLATGYSFNSHPDLADEIIIANLRPTPVQVSHWRLEWVPKLGRFWIGSIDVTPGDYPDDAGALTIQGYGSATLAFSGTNRFPTGGEKTKGRKLVLRLYLFGKRLPVSLRIM